MAAMTFWEIAGNIVTVPAVFLAARNHVLTWPIGILGCMLYGVMFYQTQLYANVTLQVFFIATSLQGWFNWQHVKKQKAARPITRTTRQELLLYLPLALLAAALYGSFLYYSTNASFPFIDSGILMLSVAGQLLLMQRKLECWYFWIAVDALATPLYAVKELYITSGVYAAFLINAVYGLWLWRREYKKQAGHA